MSRREPDGRHLEKKRKNKKEENIFEFCLGATLLNKPEITRRKLGKHTGSLKELKGMADSHGILSKCVLEVLVVWGAMVGLLTSIECAYNVPLIFAAYAMMALFFSWIFKTGKTWIRDLWYVAFLVLFIGFVVVFRKYINSGFYAMINEFLDHVTDYYGASEVKVFQEAVENRKVTVPIAAIAIGTIQIVILNIFLNNSMSVLWAVAFTLPVYIAPLFFRLEPDILPMIMGITGMTGVICLKGNRHFRIIDADDTFKSEPKKRWLVYRHSDRASLQMIAEIGVLCVIVFVVMTVVKPVDRYFYRYRDSSIKKKIEAPLGNLIMYGFESLRNTANTGGLASGRLGGVSDVTFDGETDLVVRFTPYSADRIYLKAFVGDEYEWDHWNRDRDGTYPSADMTGGVPVGRMDISNEDGMNDLLYYPYYTGYDTALGKVLINFNSADAEQTDSYDAESRTLTVQYSPDVQSEPETSNVDEKYLQIPEINQPVVAEFCENAGIKDADSVDERIQKVYSYFWDNYPYTLHPGATPAREDYVNYFLQTTRKGLCANYATAGTLILRYMGIPSRYVEGYVIDYSDVAEAEILDSTDFSYDDYYNGDSELGRTAVVQVNVTDGAAHAWIEAFIDGRWQVVELTPPSSEDEDENTQDFWSRLGNWLAGGDDGDQTGAGGTNAVSFSLDRYMWILYVIACVVIAFIAGWTGIIVFRKIVRVRSYHSGDIGENIVAYYRYMCDYARMAESDFLRAGNHREQLGIFMKESEGFDIDGLAEKIEAVSYDRSAAAEGDSDTPSVNMQTGQTDVTDGMLKQLQDIMRAYRRTVPVMRRIYLFVKI